MWSHIYVKTIFHFEKLRNTFLELALYGINFEICREVAYVVSCSLRNLMISPSKIRQISILCLLLLQQCSIKTFHTKLVHSVFADAESHAGLFLNSFKPRFEKFTFRPSGSIFFRYRQNVSPYNLLQT
jgi:hypothetical protein